MECEICFGPIEVHGDWTQGHNAAPVVDGRCCDTCNATVVVPMRLQAMGLDRLASIRLAAALANAFREDRCTCDALPYPHKAHYMPRGGQR